MRAGFRSAAAGDRIWRVAGELARSVRAGLALAALLVGGDVGGCVAGAQGKLERASEAVRDDDDDDDDHEDEHDDDWDEADWLLGGEDDAFGTALGWIFLSPFLLPRLALTDEGAPGRFLEYPYQHGQGFWRVFDPTTLARQPRWSVRPRAEGGTDFDELERFGLGLELEHASRFGLDGAWNRWREDLGPAGTDELDLGDLNLVYRFAQSELVAFRAGIGLNWLDDDRGSEFGFNTTYGVQFFPARPLMGGLELDLGTLGDATQLHLRAELGLVLERFGLFASFDSFDLDGVELHSYGLGLRGWL